MDVNSASSICGYSVTVTSGAGLAIEREGSTVESYVTFHTERISLEKGGACSNYNMPVTDDRLFVLTDPSCDSVLFILESELS